MPITPDELTDLDDGTAIRGYWHAECAWCSRGYIGRANARHCSDNCSAYTRQGIPPKPYAAADHTGKAQLAEQIAALAKQMATM